LTLPLDAVLVRLHPSQVIADDIAAAFQWIAGYTAQGIILDDVDSKTFPFPGLELRTARGGTQYRLRSSGIPSHSSFFNLSNSTSWNSFNGN
jgi:hypothetical protein